MNKYIVKSEGVWNTPSITSKYADVNIIGYKPAFFERCIGIIPYCGGELYALLSEDDDHYFDNAVLLKAELVSLNEIIQQLAQDVDKEKLFNKQYSKDNFNVVLQDRLGHSPLVSISHKKSGLDLKVDIS